jgi:hypothetical protein
LPINIHITDGLITIKAEDGTVVSIDRVTGATVPKRASYTPKPIKATLHNSSVKVSPRWTLKVGDTVLAQHKKGGRKFRTTVRAITTENDQTFVQVADPRNGGTYLLALDRIARTRS